jgi:aspartyl-tRNA(Asn)/glutamyl-tRNA(Gln) amidotransferase subunit C
MAISRDDVRRVAALARIALTEEEETRFVDDLSSVLEFVAQLEKLDVENVSPMTGGTDRETVMRDDVPGDGEWESGSADLLAAVPSRRDGWVSVPPVFSL